MLKLEFAEILIGIADNYDVSIGVCRETPTYFQKLFFGVTVPVNGYIHQNLEVDIFFGL